MTTEPEEGSKSVSAGVSWPSSSMVMTMDKGDKAPEENCALCSSDKLIFPCSCKIEIIWREES